MPHPSRPYPSAELDLERIVGHPRFHAFGFPGNRAFGFIGFPRRLPTLDIFGGMPAHWRPSALSPRPRCQPSPWSRRGSRSVDPLLTRFWVSGFLDFWVPGLPDLWKTTLQAFDRS